MRHLTLITPPASALLCTVAQVQGAVPAGSSFDADQVEGAIAVVSAAMQGPGGLNRPALRARFREEIPGAGGSELYLAVWPIEAGLVAVEVDGATLDSADYQLVGPVLGQPAPDRLFREAGWTVPYRRQSDPAPNHTVTYTAGWIPPATVTTWEATATTAAGVFVAPAGATLRMEATAAGTTGGSSPTWPTTVGATVVDGSVTWTARAAYDLPADLRQGAIFGALDLLVRGYQEPGVTRERVGPIETEYSAAQMEALQRSGGINPAALVMARKYR